MNIKRNLTKNGQLNVAFNDLAKLADDANDEVIGCNKTVSSLCSLLAYLRLPLSPWTSLAPSPYHCYAV
jgi:hypothetical protein